jgi:predicted transcriptional regulator
MESKQNNLGQLELEVLKVVWTKQPCTVLAVAEVLSKQDGYARTTTLTIIQRLTQKGFLKRKKVDGVWQYEARKEKSSVLSGLVSQFVERFFDGSSAGLIQHLSPEKLSSQEIKELEKLLTQVRGGKRS